MNWKPIETAPRDGTWVLYWSQRLGYCAGNHPPQVSSCERGAWTRRNGKWTGGALVAAVEATHWAPVSSPLETTA